MSVLSGLFPARCAGCGEVGSEPFCSLCASALLAAEPALVAGFDEVVCCLEYGGPAADALHRLKYRHEGWVARALGPLVGAAVDARGLAYDFATFVPLSRRRLALRGHNHARAIAASAGFTPLVSLLRRTKDEGPQVGTDLIERKRRVEGAFSAARRIGGGTVLLVDDVLTTGATAAACAQALRCCGADRLILAVLLRAC